MSSNPPPPPYLPPDATPPQYPYIPPPRKRMAAGGDIALKVLIGSAIGLVVGVGTCGMGATLGGGDKSLYVGLIVFVVSLVALVVGTLWLLLSFIVGWNQ